MRYCEYIFYKNNYSGSMSESLFNRFSIEASAYIKSNTFGRIDLNNVPEEVKYCMCSLVDKLLKLEEKKGKKSETVGSWKVDYVESVEDKQDLYETLSNFLSDLTDSNSIPILYRGC